MGTRSGSQYSQFPSLQPRPSVSCQAQTSHLAAHSVSQPLAHSWRQTGLLVLPSPSLWALSARQVGCMVLLSHSLDVHSWNHPQVAPVAAGEFLTKQLPAVPSKCMVFHTAPFSNQSRDYLTQGPTWPNSSLLQVLPGTPISLMLASTVPADVYRLCVSPTPSLLPPATSSIQVPPGARLLSLLWEGRKLEI